MTPFVADSVSHRTRLAWLTAALAASLATFAATRPAPAAEPAARTELGIGRCHGAQRIDAVTEPESDIDRSRRLRRAEHRLPTACVAYQERLWKLSTCDQLPLSGRRALREAWKQTVTTWEQLPANQKAHLAEGCRMGSAALDEATTAMACTYYDRHRVLYAGPYEVIDAIDREY